ncbi:helix-turn-helix domain-containing protein [Brevibacillus sp. MER 51]|uniref:winged helix-turn-helix domain-containing protein n=1 Tax=Brevibacillus sp. MER 51 TaxID=2939560 RepID=UPI00203EC571|nr:helix-turn-helix domain-containing protein [Brevibacillus sp. MER 51]MCM3144691.1 helix-turn-helix domain-containing protein [Brevibacillus sp. MER 51]
MTLTIRQSQKVKNAFESILRADYISLDQLDQLHNLEKYYVDFYNNVSSLLQKQDNFINGRRGSGKTALLIRGYYECLKTLSPSNAGDESLYFSEEKVLPIYIDLSKSREIFNQELEDNVVEINFVRQIIELLRKQLEVIFGENLYQFKKGNLPLNDLEYIENILITGMNNNSSLETSRRANNLSETDYKPVNVQYFLSKINEIRLRAKIDRIYVFIDEFSDLSTKEQESFSILFKKFLGSKVNMFFKIGVITDRYNFGEKVIIGRDIFPISLDLNDFVERYGGIVTAIKKMQDFVQLIVEKRIEIFCPELKYGDIFKITKGTLYNRLARQSLGVPRTLGLILQHAWNQSQSGVESDKRIGIQEINYGIRSVRRMYFKQFEGGIRKRLIPYLYMGMWNDILSKALSEKEKYPDRPASHLLVDPIRKEYLNVFCENFLLHILEEDRASKYGGKYVLYSLDYSICMEQNIKYAEDKDEFTAFRFVYDTVLNEYDGYFIKEKTRSFKCNSCGKIYDEEEVARFKVKRCFEDDTQLEELVLREKPKTEGNYTEVEIKILGLISALSEEEAMSASDIADAVGCSRQKVSSWGTRVLLRNNLINVIDAGDKNYYYGVEDKNDVGTTEAIEATEDSID